MRGAFLATSGTGATPSRFPFSSGTAGGFSEVSGGFGSTLAVGGVGTLSSSFDCRKRHAERAISNALSEDVVPRSHFTPIAIGTANWYVSSANLSTFRYRSLNATTG